MSSRIQYEAWLMVLSLVTGGWLMLAYDTLRVFRLVIRHGPFWTGVEDFLYWLYAGLVTFILLYEQNDGVFRAYVMQSFDVSLGNFFFAVEQGAVHIKCKNFNHKVSPKLFSD